MGVYINQNPTLAPIGIVQSKNGNNTNPALITQNARIDRIKSAQPEFRGTIQGSEFKNIFQASNIKLTQPRAKSDFTRDELCGAHVNAEKLDLIA